MSSSVHARCRTIDKASLQEAAEKLNVELIEQKDGSLRFQGTNFKFDENGNMDVKYYSDHLQEARKTKQLSQLGTYFTSVKRLKKAGLVCTKSLKDVVMAVKANQKLTLEFEEEEQQETVAVGG